MRHAEPETASLPCGRPSRLYRAEIWRACAALTRSLPKGPLASFATLVAWTFYGLQPRRRRVVIENLSPVVDNDPAAARRAARTLYRHFALKLLDLWRYEAGHKFDDQFSDIKGTDHVEQALRPGKGVLLVSLHFGNWELGAPLLARHGLRVLVLTLTEPHAPLTQWRQTARARHGIETLVVQQDPFAFLEIIRRLEQGQIVALLVDRPPPATAVRVPCMGRYLDLSIAPAELARATGCTVLPVHVLRGHSGHYDAEVHPPVAYDQALLRAPEARRHFAASLLATFEPVLRAHPEQWYHFVPIWKEAPP